MVACPPGQILPKVPGSVSAVSATNVYSLNRRAVTGKLKKSASIQFLVVI